MMSSSKYSFVLFALTVQEYLLTSFGVAFVEKVSFGLASNPVSQSFLPISVSVSLPFPQVYRCWVAVCRQFCFFSVSMLCVPFPEVFHCVAVEVCPGFYFVIINHSLSLSLSLFLCLSLFVCSFLSLCWCFIVQQWRYVQVFIL